jgi:hypothetical protein
MGPPLSIVARFAIPRVMVARAGTAWPIEITLPPNSIIFYISVMPSHANILSQHRLTQIGSLTIKNYEFSKFSLL